MVHLSSILSGPLALVTRSEPASPNAATFPEMETPPTAKVDYTLSNLDDFQKHTISFLNALRTFEKGIEQIPRTWSRSAMKTAQLLTDQIQDVTESLRASNAVPMEDLGRGFDGVAHQLGVLLEGMKDSKPLRSGFGREMIQPFERIGRDLSTWRRKLDPSANKKFEVSGSALNALLQELGEHFKEVSGMLETYVRQVLPKSRKTEALTFSNSLQSLSTMATFLSAVTATTFSLSYQDNSTTLHLAVNLLWLFSLVLSIGSATNSQLAYYLDLAHYDMSDRTALTKLVVKCITRTPVIYIIISLVAYSVGLVCFTYTVFHDHRFVCVTITCATAFILFVLFFVGLFFTWDKVDRSRARKHAESRQKALEHDWSGGRTAKVLLDVKQARSAEFNRRSSASRGGNGDRSRDHRSEKDAVRSRSPSAPAALDRRRSRQIQSAGNATEKPDRPPTIDSARALRRATSAASSSATHSPRLRKLRRYASISDTGSFSWPRGDGHLSPAITDRPSVPFDPSPLLPPGDEKSGAWTIGPRNASTSGPASVWSRRSGPRMSPMNGRLRRPAPPSSSLLNNHRRQGVNLLAEDSPPGGREAATSQRPDAENDENAPSISSTIFSASISGASRRGIMGGLRRVFGSTPKRRHNRDVV